LMRRSSGHRACNPQAVSGAEVAARAGARYAARRAGEPSVTSAVTLSSPPTSSRSPSSPTSSLQPPRRLPPPPKRLRSDPYEDHRFPALPLAEPGNDGHDED